MRPRQNFGLFKGVAKILFEFHLPRALICCSYNGSRNKRRGMVLRVTPNAKGQEAKVCGFDDVLDAPFSNRVRGTKYATCMPHAFDLVGLCGYL